MLSRFEPSRAPIGFCPIAVFGPATTPNSESVSRGTQPTPPKTLRARHRARDLSSRTWSQARIVPGGLWWLWKGVSWAVIVMWLLLGTWVGATRASSSFGLGVLAWGAAWALAGLVVTVHAIQGRWSVLILASAALAWPTYVAPGEAWSWGVYLWLAAAVAVPVVRARVAVPAWSVKAASSGNVFGQPSWHGRGSGDVVEHLTVIPGVRVPHQVAGAEHVVVLDRKVAVVGGPRVTAMGPYLAQTWPSAIAGDPQWAVAQIGAWLLSGS